MPFLANPQTAVLYPLHWPFLGLTAAKSLVASLVLHVWLAGVGTYIYARRVAGLAQAPSIGAGLVYSLGGYLGAHAGQVNQVSAAAWLPWLLWLQEEAWRSRARWKAPIRNDLPKPYEVCSKNRSRTVTTFASSWILPPRLDRHLPDVTT